ncbi:MULTISPECIES: hypothetical protein [unclassified Streptomyces]|uniref:hypothetical protein n=1 Tax=unclassified Streptomyces TaxID=2593676 RepID=UPI002E12033B|nr:hypothetical protein OG457_47585 [Streptomyces sp. NBC_01207]WTA16679.1 hypothetical protein OG365_00515 [Streptomyces sp. NBC_00853]
MPRLLGVHVHRAVSEPDEVARLVVAAADPAEVTVLPRDGAAMRAEWAAVRVGCRPVAVAIGVRVPVAF